MSEGLWNEEMIKHCGVNTSLIQKGDRPRGKMWKMACYPC